MSMQKMDVEVSRVGIEVVMPDLNSKHEGLSRHGGDGVGSGIISTSGGEAGIDDDFVEGVDDLVVEGDEEQDDDADWENASKECPVFWFLAVSQQFCSVKEVQFVDYTFQIA